MRGIAGCLAPPSIEAVAEFTAKRGKLSLTGSSSRANNMTGDSTSRRGDSSSTDRIRNKQVWVPRKPAQATESETQ
jgi:hypothetical protein